MAHTIPHDDAQKVLTSAASIAQSDQRVPSYWENFAFEVFLMDAKTYTPVLGTALLAKATDPMIDPLAIKATGERGYSLRTVGHTILVPAAQSMGFSIRTTGREPLNNQPFFRYDHMTRIERVRNREQLDWFINMLTKADTLDANGATLALAAFLRVAFKQAKTHKSIEISNPSLTISEVLNAVRIFLKIGVSERPKKLQATVAAAYELTHYDVRTRKINDPSRDYPGDVQAYLYDAPFLAVEVRGKPVLATELDAFITTCAEAGITRVALVVDTVGHHPINRNDLHSQPFTTGLVHLAIYESVINLIESALEWTDEPQDIAASLFVTNTLAQLEKIEVSEQALLTWRQLASMNTINSKIID